MMVHSPTKKSSTKSPPTREHSSSRGIFGNLKLQKGSKPLNGWKCFLDLKNLNASSKLEASIKGFGGIVSPFIGEDVNLVVTDRSEWGGNVSSGATGSPLGTPRPSPSPSPLPQLFSPLASPAGNSRGSNVSPATLDSPGELVSGGRRYPKSRGEAMLERVRLQPQLRTRDPLVDAQNWGISICSLDKILRLFHKITQSGKKSVHGPQSSSYRPKSNPGDNKFKFRSGKYFLKIESTDRKLRPSYKDFPCWPTINLESDPSASPFKPSIQLNENPNIESNSFTKLNESASLQRKQSSVLPLKQQGAVLRRSPRKKNANLKQPSPLKSKKSCVNLCVSKRCQNDVKPADERVNLVPPRPPSKRHPGRSFAPPEQAKLGPDHQHGYCEICKVDYSDLRSHVESNGHRSFSMNEDNYTSLDQLINLTHIHADAFRNSLYHERSRSSVLEESGVSPGPDGEFQKFPEEHVNMRQPVDERQAPTKMVGRKDALEVQCNGLSNHVQTRFTCTKGDRENLGSIFLDERIAAAQLRKRRAISVSCKDLLELSPSGERTHFLRSARAARSELSQLSPALSDNSHPLLNGNSQQPLLSPTLSERSHSLRTRSQIWLPSNLIGEESLLVTANNELDKARADKPTEKVEKNDKSDKIDKGDKTEKSKLSEDSEESSVKREADKELQEMCDRETKSPRNHCKNRSIRRKRLSAEEKLIEDNRGYYKVEVLNSKLRSTGYFVNHGSNQAAETPNGRITPVGRPGSQGEMKEPVVVRFKKVRRSELSVLSDEAENFMFGEQARSETNSDESSDYDDYVEVDEDTEDYEDDHDEEGCLKNDDSNPADNCNEDHSSEIPSGRCNHRNARRSNSGNSSSRERGRRLKIKVGGGTAFPRCSTSTSNGGSIELDAHRKHRKRRTQAEAFITDNMDYYKFETPETRLRIHGFPNSPSGDLEDNPLEKLTSSSTDGANTAAESSAAVELEPVVDGSPCPVDKLHFSFESVPSSEVWYQTFQRQDRGEEICFPPVGEPSSVLLPYQISNGEVSSNLRPTGRRRTKNSVRLPRKSPRCHASTLAILSSLVRRRNSRDPEKILLSEDSLIGEINPEVESKNISCKKASTSTSIPEEASAKDDYLHDEGDIQEIARNIDTILGIPSWSDADKDSDAGEVKSPGKGRGRKRQGSKPTPVNNEVAGSSGVSCAEKDKDPSLKYLVDPAIFEELSCTCDVVSNPHGGPTMDIVTLLSTYSDCCCIVDEPSADHSQDASCNSSECGASSTCELRMRKKRKRRNMTGWDKPKRRGILRRDISGVNSSEDTEDLRVNVQKGGAEPMEVTPNLNDSEPGIQKMPSSLSSHLYKKCGRRRKLRSSLVECSPRKGSTAAKSRVRILRTDREPEVPVAIRKGKFKKLRKIGWTKVR